MSRIEQLLAFIQEDPADTFSIYALAHEYLKSDRSKAWALFEQLLRDYPSYDATYYHAAKFQQEEGNIDLAEKIYRDGIALTSQNGNTKAHRELKSALEEMLFE